MVEASNLKSLFCLFYSTCNSIQTIKQIDDTIKITFTVGVLHVHVYESSQHVIVMTSTQ